MRGRAHAGGEGEGRGGATWLGREAQAAPGTSSSRNTRRVATSVIPDPCAGAAPATTCQQGAHPPPLA